jgi:hypothetical protein
MRVDLKTHLQNAEHTEVSTLRKLTPISGRVGSNSIHQNSKVACNPKIHGGRKINRKFPQKEVPKKMVKMVPKERVEIKHQSVSRYIRGTCRQFQRTCILGGKVAKLVIDPMSGMNVVTEEAVRKLGLETKKHLTPYQLEWLMKGNEVRVSKYCQVPFSIGNKCVDHVWCDVVDMATCHLLLGKPWQDDKDAIYDETKNTYSFMLGKNHIEVATQPMGGTKTFTKGWSIRCGQEGIDRKGMRHQESGTRATKGAGKICRHGPGRITESGRGKPFREYRNFS